MMSVFPSSGKRESLSNLKFKRTCFSGSERKNFFSASNLTFKESEHKIKSVLVPKARLRVKSPWKLLRPDLLKTAPSWTEPSLYHRFFNLFTVFESEVPFCK